MLPPGLTPCVPWNRRPARSKLMRVHAAVAGRHTRHGQLLPLEVYLEEGIPLVGGCGTWVAGGKVGSGRAERAGVEQGTLLLCEAAGRQVHRSSNIWGRAAISRRPAPVPAGLPSTCPPTDVPQVLHVRAYPYATLCELCEQSMHAFVSFGTTACTPPALKVSGRKSHRGVPCGQQRTRAAALCPSQPLLNPTHLPPPPRSHPCPGLLQRPGPALGAGLRLPPGEAGHRLRGERGLVWAWAGGAGLRGERPPCLHCHARRLAEAEADAGASRHGAQCPALLPTSRPQLLPQPLQDLRLVPEEALPPDGADSWVMSPYLLRRCGGGEAGCSELLAGRASCKECPETGSTLRCSRIPPP